MQRNNAIFGLKGIAVFLIVFHHFSCRYGEIFEGLILIFFEFSLYSIIGNNMLL